MSHIFEQNIVVTLMKCALNKNLDVSSIIFFFPLLLVSDTFRLSLSLSFSLSLSLSLYIYIQICIYISIYTLFIKLFSALSLSLSLSLSISISFVLSFSLSFIRLCDSFFSSPSLSLSPFSFYTTPSVPISFCLLYATLSLSLSLSLSFSLSLYFSSQTHSNFPIINTNKLEKDKFSLNISQNLGRLIRMNFYSAQLKLLPRH